MVVQTLFWSSIFDICCAAGNGRLAGDDPVAVGQPEPTRPDLAGFFVSRIHG
jgi:hypothetical protein